MKCYSINTIYAIPHILTVFNNKFTTFHHFRNVNALWDSFYKKFFSSAWHLFEFFVNLRLNKARFINSNGSIKDHFCISKLLIIKIV